MATPQHKLGFYLHRGQENVFADDFAGESVKKQLEEYFKSVLALRKAFEKDANILNQLG